MEKKVTVLLLKPLINKGNPGDIVEVKLHYAKQVLVPEGIAIVYDKQAKNQHEAHMKKVSAHKAELRAKIQTMVDILLKDGITFEKQATDNDMLYDSITERSLAQYLMQQFAVNLGSHNILLTDKIEQLGDYTADFVYDDIKAQFPIHVLKK